MWEKDSNSVDVLFSFNGKDQYARPVRLTWRGDDYTLGGVQFWYAEHRGTVLVHHYTVGDASGDTTFELSLETENLTWNLEKVTHANGNSLVDMLSYKLNGVSL